MNIEERIKDYFELNYEMMRYEAGHDITADIRELAFKQVLYYWRKMQDVAERITETEVKLSLPDQVSPEGRRFNIEGVVDIVREDNETYMYDLKTHDLDYIRYNIDLYEKQLNIYAHIWKGLRGNQLDHSCIISTAIPARLKDAIRSGDENFEKVEMDKWNPLVEIKLQQERINQLIIDFGTVVDDIENSRFSPSSLKQLKERAVGGNSKENYATRVCRNCDARYSCSSYREYAAQTQGKNLYNFKQFWLDPISDVEQEEWLEGNINNDQLEISANAADELN